MATNATFGTVAYRDGGILALPVTFAENVIAASKTIFPITHISGDALTGLDYYLIGKDTDYEIIVTVPPDRSGRFQVAANGDVLLATGSWDTVVATALKVDYNTTVPRIVDYDIPADYDLGSPVDIRVAYNTIITGWDANNTITNPGIFELEGANLGTPSAYKWVDSTPPDFDEAVPDDLTGTDWQGLMTPPGGAPTPENNFDDNGVWHGESGQYFLIRFPNPQEVGIFNLRERVGIVRGPTSLHP